MINISIAAEVAGVAVQILAVSGGAVSAGSEIAVIESMKMEFPVIAPTSATVSAIHVGVGDLVEEGQVLFTLSPKIAS